MYVNVEEPGFPSSGRKKRREEEEEGGERGEGEKTGAKSIAL